MARIRVAVIGAGAAGLCAARHLAADPNRFEFKVFEQWGEVGGTWCYTEMTGTDQFGVPIHSSMYKNLKTNVPKEIMPFPDFPFHDTETSFVHHTDVLKYLKEYAKHYDLYKNIRLRTIVKKVSPTSTQNGKTTWSVVVEDVEGKEEEHLQFDAIMVCNGHYSVPYIPQIEDMEKFKGVTQHSKDYRSSDMYRNMRVVILGAASSGVDIAMEVSTVAVEIYLSHNLPDPLTCNLPPNVKQVPGIKSASSEGFTFMDDSKVEADALIYCTGYKFNFPFLTPECEVRIDGRRVMPLYKHLIHTEMPTMCFVGLPFQVLPFPLFHFQIQYFIKTLDGSITLPSKEEMDEETERDFQKRLAMDMPPTYAHKMGSLQWDYFGELADCLGLKRLPPVVRMVYDYVADRRKQDLMHYKTESYTLLDHGNFEKKEVSP
ncbi:uncharacterized protein [Periplaneta americana]|uniref:uncharacterized protein isoform X1 n=2 Tax=Periplaneta americana TaxID=6978 RepID=UPI0037E99032